MEILRLIKRLLDRIFFLCCRIIFGWKQGKGTKTLVIVRTDGIGDLVFFLPYAESIQSIFPNSKLVLCCREESAELARSITVFHDVLGFDIKHQRWNYVYRLYTLLRIRRLNPFLAIHASYHRDQMGDELTLLSGAGGTFAFSGNDERMHPITRKNMDRFYTKVTEVPDHTSERARYKTLLRGLGDEQEPIIEERAQLRDLAQTQPPEEYSRWYDHDETGIVILAPGATGAIRRWPAERFSELADRIAETTGMKIVLCGNRREKPLLTSVAGGMEHQSLICSEATITELVSMIHRCSVFVGNDSGLLHVAATLSVPAIGILGGGHFSRYFPYGSVQIVNNPMECYECNWDCQFAEPLCITDISVDRVFDRFQIILGDLRSPANISRVVSHPG